MYRSSPFRSTLNTGYITALDMCEVCTEAVHSVAPWTRVTSQLWTSVKYEPPSDTVVHISTTLTRFYVSRTILRLHFRGAWFGNSTTLPRLYLWHPANSTTLTRAPNQPGALFYYFEKRLLGNIPKRVNQLICHQLLVDKNSASRGISTFHSCKSKPNASDLDPHHQPPCDFEDSNGFWRAPQDREIGIIPYGSPKLAPPIYQGSRVANITNIMIPTTRVELHPQDPILRSCMYRKLLLHRSLSEA